MKGTFSTLTQVLLLHIICAQSDSCTSLTSKFRFEKTTVVSATRVAPGANFSVPGSCQSTAMNGNNAICRVELITNTTDTSAVHMEAWLPDIWFGRFIAMGNSGLGGCIDYFDLPYTTNFNFAAISSDNGHDGMSGAPFLNHPEVVIDFAWRAVHTEVLVGKALIQAYYGRPQDKSYFLGCSTGGRQGVKIAEMFPEHFDGILAGAPAVDFNHLLDWSIFLGLHIGAPGNTSSKFIPATLWPVISQEIMNQCDALDGLVDGIIAEPDICIFRPEALVCPSGATDTTNCLTPDQIDALHQIYSPLYDNHQNLLFPRYDPGSEANGDFIFEFAGNLFQFTTDWYQFVVYSNPNRDLSNFSLTDVKLNDRLDVAGISTFSGNIAAFNKRGGKLLTYHGRRDQLIASGNSKRLYNRVSETLGMPNLDSFYRLFLVPGMEHCLGGQGAWAFGQGSVDSAIVNSTSHNILLALVDWVENGHAPESIIGSTPGNSTAEREHCRYPQRTVWNGTTWTCVR